jgi:hypothetical protein
MIDLGLGIDDYTERYPQRAGTIDPMPPVINDRFAATEIAIFQQTIGADD